MKYLMGRLTATGFGKNSADRLTQQRQLAASPSVAKGTQTSARINRLISACNGQKYLEIGVRKGNTLEAVGARVRVGVDPEPQFDEKKLPKGLSFYRMTSDRFFAQLTRDDVFDVVFVDGLHEYRQSYRDCISALNHIGASGLLMLDDVVPTSSTAAMSDQNAAQTQLEYLACDDWMGDVYKTALAFSTLHKDVRVYTVCGDNFRKQMVIRKKSQELVIQPLSNAALASLDNAEFSHVFRSGVPRAFNPQSLDAVVKDIKSVG